MAQTKATKKFEKNRLKDTLKRRKESAKIKQRHQLKAKKKSRNAEENGQAEGDAGVGDDARPVKKQKQEKDQLSNMSVDEFFASGFEIPSKLAKKAAKPSASAKRKRVDREAGADDSSSAEPVAEKKDAQDAASDNSGDDDLDALDATDIHKGDLKALQRKDPAFYKYLKENDAELLDFAEDANLAEIDELIESEEEATEELPKSEIKKKKRATEENEDQDLNSTKTISEAIVKKWTTAMASQHSLRYMREIVLAFRAAAHLNESDGKEYKYTISDAAVYHAVLVGTLKHVPEVLSYHLPMKELADGKVRVATNSKKYDALQSLLKSHTMSMQHLLRNLSDSATLKLTLSSSLAMLPYILSLPKAIRELTRAVVELWSDSAQEEATCISAFLIIRRLVVIGDTDTQEMALRTAYQGLVKGSRTATVHNLASINLMKNSAAELWGLAELNTAYTTAFTFVRQLAIHLRNSIKNNANESYKAVYNWQYIHCLDFWSRVLSTHCDSLREATNGKESTLRPLIYPLTQVTLGAMRLIPTSAYFPLRFQLIRSLIRLSHTTNTFIPLATPLYEVLTSAEMKKAPKPSTLKPIDFETSMRVAKSYLHTRIYQDGVGEQVVELLSEFFNVWCKNIAFPELALPVIVMLKRWLKEVNPYVGQKPSTNGQSSAVYRKGKKINKKKDVSGGNRNGKVNGLISLLIEKIDANSRFVEARRAKVDFAPNDRAGVESFLNELEWNKTPLGAFVEGQRKQREEKKRVLDEGRKEEEGRRRKESAQKERARGEDGFGGGAEADESGEESEQEVEFEDENEFEGEFEEDFDEEDDLEDE